jgi:hypothetical protein
MVSATNIYIVCDASVSDWLYLYFVVYTQQDAEHASQNIRAIK